MIKRRKQKKNESSSSVSSHEKIPVSKPLIQGENKNVKKSKPTEPALWRTFSIFLSSTFADMQAERDHLKDIIFPRVKEELQKRRIRLEVVDLRWGVDTAKIKKEDEREATVLKVCLDEIKRCRPFFIGLLGDRYGWVPPEERMKNAIRAETNIVHQKGKSVTALEIEYGVLASMEQLNRSVFYFREPLDYNEFTPEKAMVFSDEYNPELNEEDKKNRISALAKLKTDITDYYKKQGLEGEELKKKVKSYTARWDKTQEKVSGLNDWGNIVFDDIIRECENHAEDTWDKAPKNWQEEELALLDAFIEGHTHISKREKEEIHTFCGREKLLGKLKRHLLKEDEENWGLVLTGESGSGKSAVFSMVYKILQQEDCFVLAHSAGLSPKAKNVIDLLQIWNKQLSDELGVEYQGEGEIETSDDLMPDMEDAQQKAPKPEIEKIQDKFSSLLFTAAEKTQVVLLVDALDRFEPTERARYMTWLPTEMPGNVRMLCTAITGTEQNAVKYHKELFFQSIDFFTPKEAKAMLNMLCKRQHKDMPGKVETVILKKKRADGNYATSSPLWLSLAVNILMAMDNDDFEEMKKKEGRGDEQITIYMEELAKNFPPQPGKLFLSLINKAASIFDTNFTWSVFNHIACSRNGLREGDLEKLVPETKEENWDALLFANLRRWFNAHFREEGEGLQWNLVHSILRNSLLEEMKKEMKKEVFKSTHYAIANHLMELPVDDALRISETLYHHLRAGKLKKAAAYYGGELSTAAAAGATTILTECINTDQNGLEMVGSLPALAAGQHQLFYGLLDRYIYGLNDSLAIEGNLKHRLTILEELTNELDKAYGDNIPDDEFGYDKAGLNSKLGEIYIELGKIDQALENYTNSNNLIEQLHESYPKNENLKKGLAISCGKLGDIYKELGKFDQALEYLNNNKNLFKELHESNPKNENLKKGLAISCRQLGDIHQAFGKFDQALEFFNIDKNLIKELHESNPKNEKFKKLLSISYSKLGDIYKALGKFDQTLEYYTNYNNLTKELYQSNPKNENFKYGLAISYQNLGGIYMELGKIDQALEYYTNYNNLTKELYESNPKNEKFKNILAISYSKLGDIYQDLGKHKQALEYYNNHNNLSKELYESNPKNENLKKILAASYSLIGNVYEDLGKNKRALKYYNTYNNLTKELCESNPKNESFKQLLAASFSELGNIYQALGKRKQALEYYNTYNNLSKELYESNPKNYNHKKILASSYAQLGNIYQELGNFNQALVYFNNYNNFSKELYESNPKNIDSLEMVGNSFYQLAEVHKSMGNHQKGKENFAIWKKIFSHLEKNYPQVTAKYGEWKELEYDD